MVKQFLGKIFLVDLVKGLMMTLKYTPQPAFTFQYPAERRPVAPRFRGVLRLQVEPGTGAQTCIVCDQCAKACPDDLISLGGHREPGQKIKVLRTAADLAAGPLPDGTKVKIECQVCPTMKAGFAPPPGCDY